MNEIEELRTSLAGMLESYDMLIEYAKKNDVLSGVIQGFFVTEIPRARKLVGKT